MEFKQKHFVSESFVRTDMSEWRFTQCTFDQCDFSRADLSDAVFTDCQFFKADEIEGCQFQYTNLKDASFKNCQLAMAQFVGANCLGAEFRECDLKGANFVKANFANRVSHQVYFCSVFITGCNLSYTNFENACIEKCDLFENRWTGALLQGASLRGSDLSRGEFSEDAWSQFRFENCDLTHTELYGLDPRRVSLKGVKICEWQQEQLLEPLGVIVLPA
ncbi:Qnr family pentapeptide repeat protein [Vibrio penaeicida]|uniref:Qnr family pentapeptide repeat protein n=1 Tax=Vibrio penaeicida TaxID=104609 RepID=UPI000CEA40E7|nr:Qnr family pentapeptide repeat protein [Vibrio penaeicida]